MTESLRQRLIKTLTWLIANIDYHNAIDRTDDDKELPPKEDSPELSEARTLLEELENMQCSNS